jgi:hypothetical protein
MSRQWPKGTIFQDIVLKNEMSYCPLCQAKMHIRDHRIHKIYTMKSPAKLICHLVHCSNKMCPNHKQIFSPLNERNYAMPGYKIGWDVFVWIGFKRFKQHWSVPQIRNDLLEHYFIFLSEDAIEDYIQKYQIIVTARQSDFSLLKSYYKNSKNVILSIDGLQPEIGHEVLYVVREVKKGRVWFAEALISSAAEEITRIIHKAKNWVESLGLTVDAWVSDKQEAILSAIALEFPGVPHRLCKNHFLRDVAKETFEIDREAKVQMRKKVRGLRALELSAIEAIKKAKNKFDLNSEEYEQIATSSKILSTFCTMIRGILNDNDNGPLDPPGLRMSRKLGEVRLLIKKLLLTRKKGNIGIQLRHLLERIDNGLELYEDTRIKVIDYVGELKRINRTLISAESPCKHRLKSFNKICERLKNSNDPVKQNMAGFMIRFSDGLFSGGDNLEIPEDNQDLERWFKTPKSHERRINGHKHAGTRIVYEGPTLLPTLDAHKSSLRPFQVEELLPYVNFDAPETQVTAIARRQLMKRGNSKKKSNA